MVCGAGYKDKVSYALRGSLSDGTVERVTVTVGTLWWDHDSDPSTPDVPALQNDGDSASNEQDDVGTSCEVLLGGMGNDTLTGDDNTTKGHASDTKLMGDTLYGGADSSHKERGAGYRTRRLPPPEALRADRRGLQSAAHVRPCCTRPL